MPFEPLPLIEEEEETQGFEPLPLIIEEPTTKVTTGFEPLPLTVAEKPEPEFEPLPLSAKHPTLYGIGRGAIAETGRDIVRMTPYVKYIDPDEQDRFMELSQQEQTRELLLQNLETVAMGTVGPLAKGAWAWLGTKLPKTTAKIAKVAKTKIFGKEPAPTKVAPMEPEPTPVVAEADASPAVQKVMAALKEAKPIRAEQEAIYTKIRGERIAKAIKIGKKIPGEKGYYAKLSKMKGVMDKVEFDSIRKQVGQADVEALFTQINKSTSIGEFEKLTAGRGLAKLFGEFGGDVPTEGELVLLNNVFGEAFVKTILAKRPLLLKAKEVGLEVANIPRALMASFDLSAPLRQGVFFIGRPKQFAPAFRDMFKFFVSEKAYAELGKEIASRPTYQLMKKSRLALMELGKKMTVREEAFMSSYAEKIPLIGRGVRMSARAHTGFLNKLRADVFDDMVEKAARLGIKDQKFFGDAANFINHATGRGTLGGLEKAAIPLNAFFFSPRLIASRLNLLNPAFYVKLHPQVRKEALASLFTFGAIASTVAGLAALGGAKVGIDLRSADFMKLKFGNKRYDILGGFQQPIRMAAQVISGEVVSSTTGKVITLGEGYRSLTRTEIISRFLESKEAPVASFATALLRGKTSLGEKIDIPTEVANRFVPMVMQDMYDFYQEEGAEGVLMAAPALFGVGAMSYGGVESYGLSGKDHPKLNAELNRLKTSMGYPSTVAFGQELTNKEYKALKEKTGKEIAMVLTDAILQPDYKKMNDRFKVQRIEQLVDIVKDQVKLRMFPQKKYESAIKSSFKATKGYTEEEARQATKDFMEEQEEVWP